MKTRPLPKYAYGLEECKYCGNNKGGELEYCSWPDKTIVRCVNEKACDARSYALAYEGDHE